MVAFWVIIVLSRWKDGGYLTPSVLLTILPCIVSGPLRKSTMARECLELKYEKSAKANKMKSVSFTTVDHRRRCQARVPSRRGDRTLITTRKDRIRKWVVVYTFSLDYERHMRSIRQPKNVLKSEGVKRDITRLGISCTCEFAFSLELGSSWTVGCRVLARALSNDHHWDEWPETWEDRTLLFWVSVAPRCQEIYRKLKEKEKVRRCIQKKPHISTYSASREYASLDHIMVLYLQRSRWV